MSLHVVDHCQIDLQYQRNDWKPDGSALDAKRGVDSFSLSDIDPNSIVVKDSIALDPPILSIVMNTRNRANLIKDDYLGNTNFANVTSFVDLPSANRAANALRHAAELCANTQPF